MKIPKPLTIDKAGKLHSPDGAITITYSDPFPIPFAAGGVTGAMKGNLLHTTDCTFTEAVNTFQSPDAKGSAHLLVGTAGTHDGELKQFVPIGKGFETYHAFAANPDHYGTETEDGGHPHTPISDKGLWTWAAVEEFLSRFAGYPLQVNDSCSGRGLAYHRMCHDWNLSGHTCPGATMTDMVRVNQRAVIVSRAKQIRTAAASPVFTPGRRAHAAYGDALHWGDDGVVVHWWSQLSGKEHAAWEAAAKAVQP